ncbi:hypothetical protein N007_05285 [Alicyclobacillus acidoterrestris ATCC 49025]|nr:hypothetical protein N007_05285 [Alicyclobacillus acidoterrestris ATCC 49025]
MDIWIGVDVVNEVVKCVNRYDFASGMGISNVDFIEQHYIRAIRDYVRLDSHFVDGYSTEHK